MSDIDWDHKQSARRSRLKETPLRLPGQSIDERIGFLQEKIVEHLIMAMCCIVAACFGWIQQWTGRPLNPVVLTIIAIIAIGYAWRRIVPLRTTMKNLRTGRDGERSVGQTLEQLREGGYRVFHDVPGPGFNIDHVIVGPAGIFAIETKTRTKPIGGCAKIVYDGQTIRIGQNQVLEKPLRQAHAQASWLSDFLNDGRSAVFHVRPIVVFPEWYVERTGHHSKDDVWVLNPKAVSHFLRHEPSVLSRPLIEAASHALARHCRSAQSA